MLRTATGRPGDVNSENSNILNLEIIFFYFGPDWCNLSNRLTISQNNAYVSQRKQSFLLASRCLGRFCPQSWSGFARYTAAAREIKRHGTQGRKLVSNVYKYHIIGTGMLFVAAVQKQSKTNLFFFRFACSKVFGVPQPTKRLPGSFFVSFLINSIHVCHYFITIHSRFSQFRYSFRMGNCP